MIVLDVPIEWLIVACVAVGGYATRTEIFLRLLKLDIKAIKDKLGCKDKQSKRS